MRMKLKLAIVAFCFLANTVAQASHRIDQSVLTIDSRDQRCTIQAAGAAESQAEAAYLLAVLDKQTANLNEWTAFDNSRKWLPGVPMGQQMNPKEAATFERLRQDTQIHLVAWFVEDMRSRDLRVLILGTSTAEKMDFYGLLPKDEASEEFVIATVLAGGRDLFALKPEAEAQLFLAETVKCTFEQALIAQAHRVKVRMGVSTEPSKAASNLNYYIDLLLLARLEHVSKLQRNVRRQSQVEAPGNFEHFNVVWEAWRREDRISDSENQLSGVLNYIGGKIPPQLAKDVKNLASKPPVTPKSP